MLRGGEEIGPPTTPRLIYANVHAYPIPINDSSNHIKDDADDLNVFMFFLESASASMVRRHLPSTLDYLENTMNATIFDSMHKVGENTLPNLAALFAGLRLRNEQDDMPGELKQASTNGGYYDHWPMVWTRFAERGYATTYVEDYTRLGTFHYSGDGFLERPVDYWYFPFMEAMRKLDLPRASSKFCFGNRPMYDVFAEIVGKHISSNEWTRRRQFFFSIFSDLSHDYAFDLERADDAFRTFFATLHESGRLDRTLLIVAGDHGPRFTTIRATEAGFVEERNPFLSVWLPPSFLEKHPSVRRNLEANRHRLVSMFDLHRTLIDVLDRRYPDEVDPSRESKSIGGRGISVFRRLPSNRTCREAGVPDRYCLCGGMRIENVDDPMAWRAAAVIVDAARNVTRLYRTKCAKLRVEKILYFLRMDDPPKNTNSTVSYFVAFRTQPLGGIFEGAVLLHDQSTNSSLTYRPGTLERINSFGSRGRCVPSIQVKKFCACKEDVTRRLK